MIYHVCNRSIADFIIFNNDNEFARMLLTIRYYQFGQQLVNLARYINPAGSKDYRCNDKITLPIGKVKLVNIVAYCLMPTHIHLVLEELINKGMPIFINTILNSYTRYFNTKHGRKGPLWEGRTKRVFVNTDEQLLHLTRYVHLNPTTAYIVKKPEEWLYSSYKEYAFNIEQIERICNYNSLLNINPNIYKEFVEDGILYQRELAHIKSLALE